jgi:hypothetical protein
MYLKFLNALLGTKIESETSAAAVDLPAAMAPSGCTLEQELHKKCSASDVMTSNQLVSSSTQYPAI